MDIEQLNLKLIRAARATPENDRVPYAFEKRVMARLTSAPKADPMAFWSRALWQCAASCAAVALLLGVWSTAMSPAPVSDEELASAFESAVLAPLDHLDESL